ncbi:ribose-phosphate pyrophosphokinase [Maricaulis sp. CAU 1757]
MKPLLLALHDQLGLAAGLAAAIAAEPGATELRRFPDGESLVRIATPVDGRDVVVLAFLDRPDDKFLSLAFLARTARELGARRVGLVVPYLPYMRQDTRFHDGEAVSAACFASLVSREFDWLVTIDPHLHRYDTLAEIYDIPCRIAHAAPLISGWIAAHVDTPLLVGPDAESRQWVGAVARDAGAPAIVLSKTRHGDRSVTIEVPDLARWPDHTPVLVDDIISSGHTLAETVHGLRAAGAPPPVCIGVHGLFAGDAFNLLQKAGAGRILSTNAVPHPSNALDVTGLLAAEIRDLLAGA